MLVSLHPRDKNEYIHNTCPLLERCMCRTENISRHGWTSVCTAGPAIYNSCFQIFYPVTGFPIANFPLNGTLPFLSLSHRVSWSCSCKTVISLALSPASTAHCLFVDTSSLLRASDFCSMFFICATSSLSLLSFSDLSLLCG